MRRNRVGTLPNRAAEGSNIVKRNTSPTRSSKRHARAAQAQAKSTSRARKREDLAILLTGFEPQLGSPINASWETAQKLDGCEIAGLRIKAEQLPNRFKSSIPTIAKLVTVLRPKTVICLGEAGRRTAISIERIAINVDDAGRPDNDSFQPLDRPILPKGPAAYFSTLPIKRMRTFLETAGIPVEISQTAGTFVCNHVFYGLMHMLATRAALKGIRGGFIHIPYLTGQAPNIAGMDQAEILRAVCLAIAATAGAARRKKD